MQSEFRLGQSGGPDDQPVEWDIRRHIEELQEHAKF